MLPVLVDGRRIAEPLQVERLHGLEHFRQYRRGRIVVEVNPAHESILALRRVVSHVPSTARIPITTKDLSPLYNRWPAFLCILGNFSRTYDITSIKSSKFPRPLSASGTMDVSRVTINI